MTTNRRSAGAGGGAAHAPVIVTGMHRSGTSLVASLVEAAGVDLGAEQLPADEHNPHGYGEDVELLALQREMLAAATRHDDGGHPDWGWTEGEGLAEDLAAFVPRARALAAARAAPGRRWGWKDPRTTLLLDFWRRQLPGAVHVLVYRLPWQVADSMQRLGAEVFLRNPGYAYRIWAFYNRRLLAFAREHRDTCLLVCSGAVRRRPERFAALLEERFGLSLGAAAAAARIDPGLLRGHPPDDPLVSWIAAAHPECRRLLAELDAAADLPATELWSATPPRAPRDRGSRVSVVIPCRDHGELLLEAVASAQRSVPEPFELIVVDDGSEEPRTREVMALLRHAGCRVVTQPPGGLARARNHGFALARGPYVVPLDADNRLLPGFVPAAVATLDAHPEVGVAYPERVEFGLRNGGAGVPPFDLPALLVANYVDACTVVRLEVWSAAGGFDERMPVPGWEDWDLWLGAAARGWRFHHLAGAAFEYRVRPRSMIAAFAERDCRLRNLRYVLAKHRELYAEHMPEVLLFAQGLTGDLWRTARSLEEAESARQRAESRHRELLGRVADAEATTPARAAAPAATAAAVELSSTGEGSRGQLGATESTGATPRGAVAGALRRLVARRGRRPWHR